jgi:hypothetical protein
MVDDSFLDLWISTWARNGREGESIAQRSQRGMGIGRLNEQDPVGIGGVSKTALVESAVFSRAFAKGANR